MIKQVLFSAVILFIAAQFAASGRISIVTSPDSPCPGERNGLLCFTLQQFVSSEIITRIENLTLELEPGVHVLGSTLYVSGRKNLEIIGDNSTIVCTHGYSSYSLNIQSAQNVNISGITFVNCSRVYFYSTNRVIISGSNFHGVFSTGLELRYTNASVHSCSFVGNSIGMYLDQPSANVSVELCTFIGNRQGIYMYRQQRNISIDSCTFVGNRQGIYLSNYYYRGGTVRINNCTFRNNGLISHTGSAVYSVTNSLMITQSTFINNTGSNGVIHIDNAYYYYASIQFILSIDRCTFINNMANGRGGVLYLNFGNSNSRYSRMCSISRSVFINNKATVSGGAIYAIGNLTVAESIFSYHSAPQCAVLETRSSTSQNFYTHIASSTFLYNKAINSTISSMNNNNFIVGGVACFSDSMVTVNNNTFSHNTAAGGGGVMTVESSNITIRRSSFYNNTAGVDGGALYTPFSSSNYTITESSFTNNHAGDDGGAVFIGGAGSSVVISRNTFSHNTAVDRAGAIIVFRGSFGVTQTNMFGNMANSGDDVGICGSSINTTTSTYFSSHFRSQTSSLISECMFYGDFSGIFPLPYPEDRSNMNVAHYLQIPGAVSNATFIVVPTTSVVSTTSSTTTTEDQALKEIQSKLYETSTVTYAFFSIVLLFVGIVTVIVVTRLCFRKKLNNLSIKNDNHNAAESNNYNEIYKEPVWKDGPRSAVKLKPNARAQFKEQVI